MQYGGMGHTHEMGVADVGAFLNQQGGIARANRGGNASSLNALLSM
jgi:hypothetical protein